MRQRAFLLLAGFLTVFLFAALPMARSEVTHPGLNENIRSNGEYAIHVFQDGEWKEASSLAFDRFFRQREIDLSRYLPGGDVPKIRLVQKGGGAAHIDAVFLGGVPPTEIKGIENDLALKKVFKKDFDVIDAFEKDIELVFPENRKDTNLSITARVEAKTISKVPFQFPTQNLFKKMGENSHFYTYRLNSGKNDSTDDKEPFFEEYCRTGSGHPSGFTYGWVSNDDENLYVRIDFTPDNTMDGDKDYAKVYAKTEAGLKEFEVSVPETRWGEPDFTYTHSVPYQHKVYDFRIPLEELGIKDADKGKQLHLAFSSYGTAFPAGTYYVDISQISEGDGSAGNPWKTLHHAMQPINAGSAGTYILNVAAGIYSTGNGETTTPLTITQNNVTIQGAAGAIIDGTDGVSWSPGIVIEASNVTIRDLEVRNFGCYGIGIYSGTGNIIQGCELHNNAAGGIELDNSSPVIKQNNIYDNPKGIYVYDSGGPASPDIRNNLIYDTGANMSYGIYLYSTGAGSVNPTIYHNTIDGGNNDGIYIYEAALGSANPDIKYNIITNFDEYGIYGESGGYGGSPTIDYNDVWNNTGGNYYNCSAGTNDISQDPLYANYQLQSGSPCIDAIPTGDPPNDPVTEDLEGNTRPKWWGYDMGAYEYQVVDNDSDGMDDYWEITYFGDTTSHDGTADGDSDGLTDLQEYQNSTNPDDSDTDDDSMPDGWEIDNDLDALVDDSGLDSDGDGLTNLAEYQNNTNPNDSDTDDDSIPDGWEVTYGLNPLLDDASEDLDSDGLSNLLEYDPHGTYPNDADSDNDGYYDGEEVNLEANPADNSEYPAYTPGTYYVNISTGNDLTGDGSSDNPWKTLHHTVHHINGGTSGSYIVNVALGTYSVGSGESDGALTITQDNVTVIGESGSSPILDGSDASLWSYGLSVGEGADSVRIYNVEVKNFNVAGILVQGTNASITNCDIHTNPNAGILVDSSASTISIEDNQLHDGHDGIVVWGGSDVSIAQNQIYDHDHYGIGVEGGSPLIERNEIYGSAYSAIDIWGYTQEASPQIRNNLIYSGGSGITMSSWEELTNPGIYHNTIDGGSGKGIYCDGAGAGPDIKGNIITNFGTYGIYNDDLNPGNPRINYNDVWNNTQGNYYNCSAGINDISQDPLYASYELQGTSPCIDQMPTDSVDPVTIDFAGYLRPRDGGYDMGAYEFVSDITQDYSLPGGSGDATDYRIFTVPVELETGSALKAQMENALGTYDKGLWRVFAWNVSTSSYIEMDDPAFADLAVYPGMAFWIISTSTDTISFSGQPALDGSYVKLSLSPGWHMIALPWPATTIDLDNIAVSDGINNYWITSGSNSLTQQYVWEYTGTGPDSGYVQLASGSTLQPGKGYWIKVVAGSAVDVLVPKDNTGGYFEASSRGVGRSSTGTDSDEEPPPPPGISVSFTSNSSDGATLSAEGSCFIATAAYGSRFHPYVKTLRDFRDAYLLGNAPGRKLVTLYYRYSPPIAEIIADNAPLKYLTKLLLLPLIGLSAFMLYANPIFGFVGFMGFVGFIGFVWLKR